MTAAFENKSRANFRSYFREQKNLGKDLFRGVNSLILRQTIAWVSFLQADLFVRT